MRPALRSLVIALAAAAAASAALAPAPGGASVPFTGAQPVEPSHRPAAPRPARVDTSAVPVADPTGAPPPADVRTFEIVDAADGTPVGGATVEVSDSWWSYEKGDAAMAEVDEHGVATIPPTGDRVAIVVRARGHVRQQFDGVPSQVRLERCRSIDGRVVDALSGEPMECVRVAAYDEDDSGAPSDPDAYHGVIPWDETCWADHGEFRLDAGRVGPLRLSADARDYERADVTVGDPAASGLVTLRLLPTGAIRGTVRDPDGRPLQFVDVHVEPEREGANPEALDEGHAAMTDEEGRYEITRVSLDRPYRLWTDHDWDGDDRYFSPALPASGVVATRERRAAEHDFVMREAADLRVVVRDDAGIAVPDAEVHVAVEGWPEGRTGEGRTEADGTRTVSMLPPGRAVVDVNVRGSEDGRADVDLAEGTTRTVEIVVRRGHAVSGNVVDDEGHAIADAEVRAAIPGAGPADGCAFVVRTADDGSFRALTTVGGPLRIAAERTGYVTSEVESRGDAGATVLLRCTRVATVTGRAPDLPAGETAPCFDWTWTRDDGGVTRGSCWPEEGEDWRFSLRVPPGAGVLRLLPEHSAAIERHCVTFPGSSLDLGDVAFAAGETLSAAVVDEDGRPVFGARVEVVQETGTTRRSGVSGDGRATLRGLDRARTTVSVECDEFAARSVEIAATEIGRPVTIALRRGAELRVVDRGPQADSQREVHVTVSPESAGDATAPREVSGCRDGTSRMWLAPGRYVVRCGAAQARAVLVAGEMTRVVFDLSSPPPQAR